MAKNQNPFAVSMATLYIPAHMGKSINLGGFELEADDDGAVEVPKEHVATLKGHGLTEEPEAKASPAGARVGQVSGSGKN